MLTIRLSRIGKKKKPMYRLIISEKARDPYGRALEILGSYNPFTKELTAKKDRIEYWLSKGAQMSPTVNNLLVEKEVIKKDKVRAYSPKKKEKSADAKEPENKEKENETKSEQPKEEKVVKEEAKPEAKEETKEDEKQGESPSNKDTQNKENETKSEQPKEEKVVKEEAKPEAKEAKTDQPE